MEAPFINLQASAVGRTWCFRRAKVYAQQTTGVDQQASYSPMFKVIKYGDVVWNVAVATGLIRLNAGW